MLGDFFYLMPIAVARGKIHVGIHLHGVRAQDPLNHTHVFDKLAPVRRAQEAQATDRVTDRHLISGLLLISRLNELFYGQIRFCQMLLNPGQRKCQRCTLSLQTTRKFGNKGSRHRRIGARHVCGHQNQAFWIGLCNLDHLVYPGISQMSFFPSCGDTHRHAAQIFDQS